MNQTQNMLASLKKCLRIRGLTYRDLADALAISEASVKRNFSENSFSLQRLEQVCQFLDMSFYDLARLTKLGNEEDITALSVQQEEALAKDPLVLTYFYLLLTGRSPSKIATEFGLDDLQQATMLARLSKLGLVELLPRNNARLLTSRRIDWRHSGPIRKKYQREVQRAFMDSDFEKDDEIFRFETGELSPASVSLLAKKLEKLAQEFDEYTELDISTTPTNKKAYGLMLCIRPWAFWQILEGTANDMGLNAERSQVRTE